MRLRRRRALLRWIAPRLAALSSALAAAAIAAEASSPPLASVSRAVRTAVRAAERPTVLMAVRRTVCRMRFRAERLRFFAATGCERYRMLQYSRGADVRRARLGDHDLHPRRQPGPRMAAPFGHRRQVRRVPRARRLLGRVQDPRRDLRAPRGGWLPLLVSSGSRRLPRPATRGS